MEARNRFERVLKSFPILDLSMDRCAGEPTGRAASMRQVVGFHGGLGSSSDMRSIVEPPSLRCQMRHLQGTLM